MPAHFFLDPPRIVLAAGILAVAACAGPIVAKHHVPPAKHPQPDAATTIVVSAGKRGTVRIPVTLDPTKIDSSGTTNRRSIKVVGQRGDTIVEILDSYPSKPQGMSRCQSGSETYFRVLDTVARRQLFARLVDSCLDARVKAADTLITRTPDGDEITLHGLYSSFTIRIGPDGVVMPQP